MGNLASRVADLVDDLKHSWYFRFWAIFWGICFIFAFVAFILYSSRSSENTSEPGWRMWVQEQSKIVLPKFQFRTAIDQPGNIMMWANCAWKDEFSLSPTPCNDKESIQICAQFDPSAVAVTSSNNWLNCAVNMTAPPGSDRYLAFKVNAGESFDPNDVYQWLQSSNGAYISLSLARVKSGGSFQNYWSSKVSYRTNVAVKDLYIAILQMESFHVLNYEKTDWYTGWMAAADIGGFAFFLVILHWMVMTFLNIFMENNSKFLGTGAAAPRAQYNQL